MGDGNADWLAYGLEDAFSETPDIAVIRKHRTDSGLIRYDQRREAGWPQVAREIIAAKNETEQKLVDIWKQVLGVKEIGTTDDIFELGGDSILIFQISTRATRAGLYLAPAQVFRHRNIAALAADLNSVAEPAPAAPTIQRVNRDAYRRKL